jgi:NAD(P)-dependent dehydrogenase (short-subunit alcohol dehydrogenase family)
MGLSGRFDGRVAFVTGAGSGIGRATAERFVREGARVFAVDVDRDCLSEAIAELRTTSPAVDGVHCDVADGAAVEKAVARCVEAFGGLNLLLNVAGIGGFQRFEELDEKTWTRTLAVNLTGPFHTTRAALPHLLQKPVGCVVNVASTAGMRGTAYAAAYAASKAGLVNLTKTLALEFASRNLRFNCICPGGVRTPLIAKMFQPREDLEKNLIAYSMPPKPGNLADPEDIAGLIAFLASDEARMMNGVALLADGGALA